MSLRLLMSKSKQIEKVVEIITKRLSDAEPIVFKSTDNSIKKIKHKIIFGEDSFADSKGIFEALAPSRKPLTMAERTDLLAVQNKVITDVMTNIGKYSKGIAIPSLAKDFSLQKNKLIKELKNVCTPEQIKKLEHAKTPEKLTQALFEEEWQSYSYMKRLAKDRPKKTTLDMEQLDYTARVQRGKFIMAREHAMHIPSVNPEVVKIEQILREQYGVEFVSLKDNVEMAKNVLKGFETAKKAGVPLPKNVIISDFMVANGERIATEDTILLASTDALSLQPKIQQRAINLLTPEEKSILKTAQRLNCGAITSTLSPEHTVVHEIMHGSHPFLIAYSEKRIPSRLMPIKEKLSAYSATSKTHETYTELAAKKAIKGLTAEETELYNFLNFYG